jgi:hypothetical protein
MDIWVRCGADSRSLGYATLRIPAGSVRAGELVSSHKPKYGLNGPPRGLLLNLRLLSGSYARRLLKVYGTTEVVP